MKEIRNQVFPHERDLYGSSDLYLKDCLFAGAEDGESALKESSHILLEDCRMELRYPFWHNTDLTLRRVSMTETCRAALWYTQDLTVEDCTLHGIKALRECLDISIARSDILSPEFGWRSHGIRIEDSRVEGEYPFLMAGDLSLKKVELKGKYSFQYVENMVIEDSVFDTKDAFWHSKNVTVRNSVIRGEYLAWYSEGLTLENCKIIGTQPLCYCRNLKLIHCETEAADLAFEYSDVEADLTGHIVSVKNPRSGYITADSIGEVILTEDSRYPCQCRVETKG